MAHKPFVFRHFIVEQDKCTMKIGTDAMLLGAWVQPQAAKRILDIGTGTGVLALMMAQRSHAFIDAVEPDAQAYLQACRNFAQSSWSYRIHAFQNTVQDFNPVPDGGYDLIISNPPYFDVNLKAAKESARYRGRIAARSYASLSFEALIENVASLLADDGIFYAVLPAPSADVFIELASKCGLFCLDFLHIYSKQDGLPVRCILGLGRQNQTRQYEKLVIYDEGGNYTADYISLTKDFHARNLAIRKK